MSAPVPDATGDQGDELDLDAIEERAREWREDVNPDTVLALVAEVRRLRALVAPTPPSTRDDCLHCGHRKREHIYEEGACRPGYPCAGSCEAFVG